MKKIKANSESEFRVYFIRLKKEDDADIIDYLDNNIRNFTEYFRVLVKNDMNEKNINQHFPELPAKTSELAKSINNIYKQLDVISEKTNVYDNKLDEYDQKINMLTEQLNELKKKYSELEKGSEMTKIKLIETLQSQR